MTTASSPSIFEVGALIDGKYRIERVLGQGGMGIVYAAQHELLAQPVALKVVLPEIAANSEVVARFMHEARAAAKIDSDHVARVMDVGRLPDGTPYMVMEFLTGRDLDEHLAKNGALSPEAVADLLLEALDGVAHAHALGIVHRDLKPANLFLAQKPGRPARVKVLDFGIAKALEGSPLAASSVTSTKSILGSPAFMAPEQAMGKTRDIDARTDLWAVAATLFSVLSGRQVHEGETVTEVLILRATTPARSLATVAPAVAPSIVAAVDRGLAFDRKDRWESASAMRAALQRAQLEAFGAPVIRPAASSSAMLDTLGIDSGPALSGRPELASQPRLDVIAATQALPPDGSAAQATRSAREAAANRPLLLSLGVGALLVLGGAVAVVALQHGTASAEPPRSAPAASAPATPATTATPSDPPPLAATAPPTPAVPASSATAASSAPVPPRATARAASPRQVTTPSAARAVALTPPPSCDPPFSIDSSGIKHPKPECMR